MVFHLDAMRAVVDPEGLCFVMFTMNYDVDWTMKKFAMPMDANVWAFDGEFPVYLLAHFAKAKPDAHHIFFFSLVNSEHEKGLDYHVRIGGFQEALDTLVANC